MSSPDRSQTLGDKLFLLARLCHTDVQAIELIVDAQLERRMAALFHPPPPRVVSFRKGDQ